MIIFIPATAAETEAKATTEMNSSECFNRGRSFLAAVLLFAEMTICGVFFLFLGFVLAGWETIEQAIEVFHDNRRSPRRD